MLDVIARTAEVCFMPRLGRRRHPHGGGRPAPCCAPGPTRSRINTAAVEDPDLIAGCADAFGAQATVVAIDAKRRSERRGLGGLHLRRPQGDRARRRRLRAERRWQRGAGEILLTSMDRDGARDGYDLGLLAAVTGAVGVPVIASGGAGSTDHWSMRCATGGADAVLAASIFHFGEISIGEAKARDGGGGRAGAAGAGRRRMSRFGEAMRAAGRDHRAAPRRRSARRPGRRD